jgi:catechol 2,3-dioxygenase-like lactoylglutathione lyase family enzyme
VQQAVHFITLGVQDLTRSRAFYRDALGWVPTIEVGDEISFFQVAPGVLLGVWGVEHLAEDSGGEPMHGTSSALAQNFATDAEVDAAFERAVAAGATPLKPPQRHPAIPMYHAYVADPDGHRWELACNPGWSVDADGTVRLS